MRRLLAVALGLAGFALAVACSSHPDGSKGTSGVASGSSGGASGSSGTSGGSTGSSGGASGSSGGGDAADDGPMNVDEPCTKNEDCARAKTSCVLTAPAAGTCKPTCAPFGTDCAASSTCTAHAPETAGVTQISTAAFCRIIGGAALGATCVDDPGACGANAECLFFPDKGEGVPQSRCHSLCDPTHACGAGQGNCVTKPGEAFGFCDGG